MELKRIIEALLFASNKAMSVKQLQQVFPELEQPEPADIEAAVELLVDDYAHRAIELKKVASGYRFQVKADVSPWVGRLFEEKPPKYSRALLETLAIIAYRQPVTRGDIEDIRGVSVSSNIIKTLLEREWVRVVAHKEIPGRPALFGTTKQFLDYFNLAALSELPTLQEMADLNSLAEHDQHLLQVNSEQQEANPQQSTNNEASTEAVETQTGIVGAKSAIG
ncbi:MAG: SMC-Scp complex subunit ScpB [Methylicorpusculum sp.]|uniref:SMC-Scp complex subunit ScpB n=1 Tax=Methylicorpusculum sp. TaxID=2713644 RepID=UPI002728D0F7|nr:SMC-Scp complex subunit ScpB [Methylicorpusculum sp.]MDO8845847.1 SMC-Scp complex subunit ScpB [Methylicorpusculum sp.]MDO8939347.1 SMC-Scp complex subunit ScpB [Methylicorpusculum sp.]MDO9241158.1 SMC-Scp complex subunit ScpB [Methylicorpusculum sp.]MDP2201707.1 SMC-Scp complex subunit ScpB [Methylicorpusculum sp.]